MGTVTLASGGRDVSFSSYLNGSTDESFVLKLAESNGSPRKKAEDGEIGVFGAEKYFSGGMDHHDKEMPRRGRRMSLNQNEEGFGFESFDPMIKPKIIQPRTPSLISETSNFMRSESSWVDSQSALTTSVLRNPPRNKTKMTSRKSLLASLRCKCSCSDKNSVETTDEHMITKDKSSITKEPAGPEVIHVGHRIANRRSESQRMSRESIGMQREKCFAFPLANSGNPRNSMEIFGSPILEKGHKHCLSLERRNSMLSWDWEATPRALLLEDPGISNDTAESDASSDLFEIESLSSRVTMTPFLAHQESDNNNNMMSGCVTPTTCYAPSEASIEWSVVTGTGSVADYSVMSDCDDLRPPVFISSSTSSHVKSASKEVKIPRPMTILSGCKNDKAVRVAGEEAYIRNDKAISEPRRDQYHRAAAFPPIVKDKLRTRDYTVH